MARARRIWFAVNYARFHSSLRLATAECGRDSSFPRLASMARDQDLLFALLACQIGAVDRMAVANALREQAHNGTQSIKEMLTSRGAMARGEAATVDARRAGFAYSPRP